MTASYLPASSPLPLGIAIAPPPGWLEMLRIFPAEAPSPAEEIALTEARLFDLVVMHDTLRRGWRFAFDLTPDHWNPAAWGFLSATGTGDCEDWALAARQLAVRRGLARGALRIACCLLPWLPPGANGHAVLTVWTDRGVFCLDLGRAGVWPWAELPYTWQAVEEPGSKLWRAITPPVNLADLAPPRPLVAPAA